MQFRKCWCDSCSFQQTHPLLLMCAFIQFKILWCYCRRIAWNFLHLLWRSTTYWRLYKTRPVPADDFTPVKYKADPAMKMPRPVPPYNGFGSEEDSLCSCMGLIPKPPQRDFIKFMEKDRCICHYVFPLYWEMKLVISLTNLWFWGNSNASHPVKPLFGRSVCTSFFFDFHEDGNIYKESKMVITVPVCILQLSVACGLKIEIECVWKMLTPEYAQNVNWERLSHSGVNKHQAVKPTC